jgi:hypothetical protein
MQTLARGWRWLDGLLWAPADPRTYALVRIAFSIAALANWLELWARRQEYFGPAGLIDHGLLLQQNQGAPYWSAFYLAPSETGVAVLFLAAGLAIIALGLGWHQRLAALLVFVWHVSYSHVAFPVLHGWDSVLRVYSFLVLVSPLPHTWCVGSRPGPTPALLGGPPVYGLRLMQWQLAAIYLGTIWLKVDDPSWRSGEIVALFQVSIYSRIPDVTWLAHSPIAANLLTWGSLAIETSVVFVLASARWRWLGFGLGLVLHGTIALAATLTTFSLSMLAPYASFVTGKDIDEILNR